MGMAVSTARRASAMWRRWTEAIHPHRLPLAVVLLACALGQLAVLTQRPLAWLSQDSGDYIHVAERILTTHQVIDAYRTPGYPLLLALIFSLAGGERFDAVALVQAALIVLAAGELYVLSYRVCRQRWLAATVAAVTGLNVFATSWERVVMTETLAYWLVVTLFLVFERYLRSARARYLIAFVLLSGMAIMTRPIFILLPALLLLVLGVWAARTRSLVRHWKALALTGALIYGFVLAYMGANGLINGYYGLSDATNILLFGKVLRFDMYALPLSGSGQRYAQLQVEIERHVAASGLLNREPWGFVAEHPTYAGDHLAVLGAFSRAEIAQHPLYFAEQSLTDVRLGFYAGPDLYAPAPYAPLWITALYALYRFYARVFGFFPLLFLAVGVWVWRRPEQVGTVVCFTALLAYAELTLIATVTSYEGFWRLRFPIEWGVTLVGTITLVAVVRGLARALARWRGRPVAPLAAGSGGER